MKNLRFAGEITCTEQKKAQTEENYNLFIQILTAVCSSVLTFGPDCPTIGKKVCIPGFSAEAKVELPLGLSDGNGSGEAMGIVDETDEPIRSFSAWIIRMRGDPCIREHGCKN
jgi:hypothetical protein